ncbi:MAG: FtsX-like permease family protein [Chloroflexota bacterium]
MIRPRWRKVLRDLLGNKVRTMLVVFSIGIGVFAIGMIVGTQILLDEDLSLVYSETNPAHAVFYPDSFDQDLVDNIERIDGVKEAQGRSGFSMSLQKGEDEWVNLNFVALDDFEAQRIHTINYVSGEWPPPERTIIIEQASLPFTNAEVGDTITVRASDDRLYELEIVGLAHDIWTEPVQFTQSPNGFISLETMEWLGFGSELDELHIVAEGNELTRDDITEISTVVENKIEKSGRTNYFTWIPEPGEHPAQEIITPLLAILGALGVLALLASAFLVINIINGLLAQHTQQIGIMKAIGARRNQIVLMYLVSVVIFGILSLIIAIPLGGLAAYAFTSYLAGLINFELLGFRIPIQVIIIQVAVAMLTPVLAAFIPVVRGTTITVREALSEHGLGKGQFGSNFLDRLVNWISATVLRLSRPMRISLRNTVRRKARLILTLITLTLGGAIFIGVLSVQASLLGTLDDALSYFAYDVDINFSQEHRIETIQREALKVPGVVTAESWIGAGARRVLDGEEGEQFFVIGTNAETEVIKPILLEGRWLLPTDTNSVVLNSLVLKEESDIQVGDQIIMKINDRELEWNVVGIVQGVMTGGIGYVNQPFLAKELRFVGKATGVQIVTEQDDAEYTAAVEKRLRDHFQAIGLDISNTSLTTDTRQSIESQFNIIVTLLVVMAILVAFVGGLGLMGTMSINVLERTREIGVMRAVGASDNSILRIVLVEGILVGVISWLFGGLMAYPIGFYLSDLVGTTLLESSLRFIFATNGALGWLIGIILIGTLASILPAWNASQLSVRQTLAYE